MPEPLLQVTGVSKQFWGVRVLDNVHFQAQAAEIHAIAGENGAGKSTLMKIIAGQLQPDSGEIRFRGRAIAMIHQELLPFAQLSVAENIFMGREPTHWFPGWVDQPERDRQAAALLNQLGLSIDPRARMGGLSVAEQQSVEIAKALGRNADLLIMDEPTSALSDRECELLFRIMLELKGRGVSILYISHRMHEIFRLASPVPVMRDGRHVATRPTVELDEDRLIALMVGRALAPAAARRPHSPGETILEVRDLARPPRFQHVEFSLRRGEILGLAGLMGAGRSDVAAAIFGLAPAAAGKILLHGKEVSLDSPAAALAHGIAMVTEDRREFGFVPAMSVKENITLSCLDRLSSGLFIRRGAESRTADEEIRKFHIRSAGRDQAVKYLSGGNQQKVALARALLAEPEVIILDEPTRGIDVAAKSEIYNLIAGLAAAGKAVLLISSEMNEILALSDFIVVMRAGVTVAGLSREAASPEQILRYAMPN